MMNPPINPHNCFNISNEAEFQKAAMEVFRFQSSKEGIYSDYLRTLNRDWSSIQHPYDIPFLPIHFFKTKKVVDESINAELIFGSSGTSSDLRSLHFVSDKTMYEDSFSKCFRLFYGQPQRYTFLALLPSYLERSDSSLIYMVESLMRQSGDPDNGFYLHQYEVLREKLLSLKQQAKSVILLGVTFALLDMAESFPLDFPGLTIIETGGMKGRAKEPVREEVHHLLKIGFGTSNIHSEYGMTELLSQAYAQQNGRFFCPPWMKVVIRELNDPFQNVQSGKSGAIHIIDLANFHSCSFLATQDLGRLHPDGSFEVLGRYDHAELRGCNLLIT